MNGNELERIPEVWREDDATFFRIVAFLFPANFCAGSSVLLVNNSSDTDVC